MAKSNLSLAIVVRLLTDNFNKGATRVKTTLLQLQRNFLALAAAAGAGSLGITSFISKMIEVTKETSRASIALKNVSESTAAYAQNQQWLLEISKKYGVEINSLTSGFAKFKAAADISNMSLEDQRKIFEAVSRATVAFGLSAEDQRGVFMALSQMMSKNKVMAEELRLQLAERMPVAIQAMANAAGVSVEQLDALMKQGKVMSSEVLPRFAEELTKMTPNLDLDNLNKSLVDLSNAFQAFAKNLGIESMFKGIVDRAANLMSGLAENTKAVMEVVKMSLIGAFGKGAASILKGFSEDYERALAASLKKAKGVERTTRAAVKTEEAYQVALREKLRALEAQRTLDKGAAAEARLAIEERVALAEAKVKETQATHEKALAAQRRAEAKATEDVQRLAAAATATGWTKAWNTVTYTFGRAWKSIKAAVSANIWAAAITGVTALVAKLWESVKAAAEARKAFEKLGKAEETGQAEELKEWQALLNSPYSDSDTQQGALSKINSILGAQLTLEDDINAAIERRLALLNAEERYRLAAESFKAQDEQLKGKDVGGKEIKRRREESLAEMNKWRKEIALLTGRDNLALSIYSPDLDISTSSTSSPAPTAGVARKKYGAVGGSFGIVSSLNEAVGESMALQNAITKVEEIMSRMRDTSGDWKLSELEILEADKVFSDQKISDLLELARETGVYVGDALAEGLANSTDLSEAIRLTEMSDALADAQKELDSVRLDALEEGIGNIDNLVGAFERLSEVMAEDATGWERIMAVWGVFEAVAQGIISTIEAVAEAQKAQAAMKKIAAANTIAANTGEAASEVGSKVAKESGGWAALIAVPAAIAAIVAAFAAIPKFANGGIVGGTSTHGDRVLARLNSGEGILTPQGLESLHDAANPRNTRSVQITGVLKGRGRDLVAVIDTENRFKTRTR